LTEEEEQVEGEKMKNKNMNMKEGEGSILQTPLLPTSLSSDYYL